MKTHLHYSSVGFDENRMAGATIAALLRSGDRGGDQQPIGTTVG
jgi:hypothetical protein